MWRTEDDPAEDNKKECTKDLEGFFPCRQESSFGYLVRIFAVFAKEDEREEKEGVVCAPSYESPVGAMPESGEKEDDKGVADDNKFLVAVGVLDMGRDFRTGATKRDIDIIAKTCCEGDMPSPPKLCYIAREVRIVEVAHQFDAKEFGRSYCYVTITGEIAVDLEGKENGCQQECRAGLGVVGRPNLINIRGAVVGNYYFLEQAP